MSSYDCVLPIDFDCFENKLLPDALRVLSGELPIRDFVTSYIPKPDKDFIDEYCFEGSYVCIQPYVALFRKPMPEWLSEAFRQTPAFQEQQELEREAAHSRTYLLLCWEIIFEHAVKQTCAVELPGQTLDDTHNGYYSRLHEFPEVQVAGVKNGWRFLGEFYNVEWLSDKYISVYRRARPSPNQLFELLEKLFLGVRCLPSIFPAQLPPSSLRTFISAS